MTHEEAGQVTAAATLDVWDLAFLALDTALGMTIEFTSSYVLIGDTQ